MSFFDASGLKASTVARTVESMAPMRVGIDDRFWAYQDGVWSDAERLVRKRIVQLLDERYRPHHAQTITDVLRARLDILEMAPVENFINVYNGMIDWRPESGPSLIPHDPLYFSTVQLPVTFHPEATCPTFDAFLAEAVDAEDRARVWETLGYMMMSSNPLQRTFLLTGGGGNGKGVLLEVIKKLLGDQNCAAVPLHEFSTSQFATAELFGRLANICGDIDSSFLESTARIKEVTGEDTVKGERKFGQPFYFRPWCKMIFSANEIPASADSSSGWTRRFEVINFPNQPARPDSSLKHRVTTTAELRGIAAHAIASLRTLMTQGAFTHGVSAMEAHEQFAEANNVVLRWVKEECDYPNPSRWYDRRDLYKAYRRWDLEFGGGRPLGSNKFYARLRQVAGMRETRRQGLAGFAGLLLRRDIAFGLAVTAGPDLDDPVEEAPKQELPPAQAALDLRILD